MSELQVPPTFAIPLTDPGGRAVLDLMCFSFNDVERLWITRINVPAQHRGCGYGRTLLEECLRWADQHGLEMWIQASPYPDSPIQNPALADWYARHGFEDRLKDRGACMVRPAGGGGRSTTVEDAVAPVESPRQGGPRRKSAMLRDG